MRRTILPICLVITLPFIIQAKSFILEHVNQLKWENRIILIRSMNDINEILSVLKTAKTDIQDRHIYWFIFTKNKVYTNFKGKISNNFSENAKEKYFEDEEMATILIGKDGYIKNQDIELNLNFIFDLIDSMPMRQMEMKN